MRIPVGPYYYDLAVCRKLIPHQGGLAEGLCDRTGQRITISLVPPPSRRLATFWHELAHAWRELDIHEAPSLDDESMANLVGLAMARMDAHTLARIHILLTTGMEADEVLMIPGVCQPIPLLRFSSDALA